MIGDPGKEPFPFEIKPDSIIYFTSIYLTILE
jgi:hypothetical protein